MRRQGTSEQHSQAQRSTISRRALTSRAAIGGVSAVAGGVLTHLGQAQDASPVATPGTVTRSITRSEHQAALKGKFPFQAPTAAGGQIVHVDTTDISTLNPILVTDTYSAMIAGFLYEGLVRTSPIDGTVVPALADFWEVTADGMAYRFYLSRDARWHDGEPVTADDVILSFDAVVDETSLSARRSGVLNALRSYRKVDDYTVELVAVDRLANFVYDAAGQVGIVPKHIWDGIPFADWGNAPGSTGEDPDQVIGSGPFTFVEWVRGDHVTLARNAAYREAEATPVIDEFIYRVVADSTVAVQSLLTGETDIAPIPAAQVETVTASHPDVHIDVYDTFAFTYYEFNLDPARALPFTDVRVRQALMYALDRDLIVETIYLGLATPAVGTQPVLSIAYAPDRIDTIYAYQPDKAARLLADAGWVDSDGDGIRDKDGSRFSFELLYSEGSAVYQQLIPYLQQAWREVGVEMIPIQQPFPTLVDNLENGTFTASILGYGWDAFGSQGDMYRCDAVPLAGYNDMRYCNPRYDELDALQRRELDPKKRVDILIEQTNIVNDDQANSVLVFFKDVIGSQSRVHNFFPNGYSTFWSIPYAWVER